MKVLCISVHPDDETLGCGGTLLKHKSKGDQLYWLIFTDVKINQNYNEIFAEKRENEILEVAKLYQFDRIYRLGFPAAGLHTVDINVMIQAVSEVIDKIKPECIYLINRSDIHTDHQIAFKVMMSCTKGFRYPFIKQILMYECISETELSYPFLDNAFVPNAFSDITDYLDKKIDIMRIYESEINVHPFPRSASNIKALAMFRGAMIGVNYAEAFMVLRDIF
jgi:LmbE family N-acetylglucosaminyl deacetylase